MNRIFRLIALILCVLFSEGLHAQELTFKNTIFDFGKVAEEGGVKTTRFIYTNTGDKPVVIITASSSCGCTVPSFDRKPLAVGESSSLEVTFDPMDRPGKFSKSVQVLVAPGNVKYVLTIVGDVTPRPKSTEELYPFDMGGGLRLAANYYPLSYIEQGQRVECLVGYINTSKRDVRLELVPISTSGYLDVEAKRSIAAGEQGSIAVSYDLERHKGVYGLMNEKYAVRVNGKEAKYNLMFNGHAVDRFGEEERSAPPICNIGSRIIKFGNVSKGKLTPRESFVIENTGVSDLIIRDVDLGEGVRSTLEQGVRVAAGESRKFEVWVDCDEIDYGTFSRYITFTVNDPDVPVQRVRVTGIVEG